MKRSSSGPLPLVPQGFVSLPQVERLGRLTQLSGTQARVEIVRSLNDRREVVISSSELSRAYLSPQTRVYLHDPVSDTYKAGRVIDYDLAKAQDGLMAYEVSFPNSDKQVLLESNLIVRSLTPVEDPTEVLVAGGAESQFLFDRRLSALRAVLEMRAATSGIETLVSASVELLPHQIEIVRRVLGDSLQRYLLADEVGLGKTIEACAILKRVLEEAREHRVALVVPPPLVWQWERELKEKFDIDPDDGRVSILTLEQLALLAARPDSFELLIIDEAHRIVGGSDTKLAEYLRAAATAIPRLLLLTATPILGDELSMLELLHLLDPVAYPLNDLSAFHEKLKQREAFGAALLALDPGVPPSILRPTLDAIADLTSGDAEATGLIERVRGSVDASEHKRLIRDLKAHVSEAYRLHHRLLRTRRTTVEWPARQCVVEVKEDEDERIPGLASALEEWRMQSLRSAGDYIDPAADVYTDLIDALGRGIEEFNAYLAGRTEAIGRDGSVALFATERHWLSETSALCERDRDQPSRLVQAERAVREVARRITGNAVARHVVFTSSTESARQLAARLQRPGVTVSTIVEGMTREETEGQLAQFVQSRRPAFLVCDASGEEGLNLQVADGMVFLDLPIALSRLEQRIGRLDRLGRLRKDIPLYVFLPDYEPESPWSVWLTLLDDAFRLFQRSISDVQFLLDGFERRIKNFLFAEGAIGLDDLINEIRDHLQDERRRLDQQYALDQLDLLASGPVQMYEDLTAMEAREQRLGIRLDRWLFDVMQFDRYGGPEEGFVTQWREQPPRPTLAPAFPWKGRYGDALERRVTYLRHLAVRDRRVRLIRPGFTLVDATEEFMRLDDRGTAYATLRPDVRWPSQAGVWMGLHLAYVVEINDERLKATLASCEYKIPSETLIGQARALLPSWVATIRVDAELRPVKDAPLLDVLRPPYRDSHHVNLASRPHLMAQIIGRPQFAELCRTARTRSEELLRASPAFTDDFERRRLAALAEIESRIKKLWRRAQALERLGSNDTDFERALVAANAVHAAIEVPQVRLDAIGFEAICGAGGIQ